VVHYVLTTSWPTRISFSWQTQFMCTLLKIGSIKDIVIFTILFTRYIFCENACRLLRTNFLSILYNYIYTKLKGQCYTFSHSEPCKSQKIYNSLSQFWKYDIVHLTDYQAKALIVPSQDKTHRYMIKISDREVDIFLHLGGYFMNCKLQYVLCEKYYIGIMSFLIWN
jgi:hypothetical protein